MDDDFDCAVSAYDVVATPGHAMSTLDALGTPSSICPTEEAANYTDDSSDYATFTYDGVATPSCATPATGAPDVHFPD